MKHNYVITISTDLKMALEVSGVIVRRNGMGKKLSFADIRVVKKNAVGDAKEEDTEQAIVKVAAR